MTLAEKLRHLRHVEGMLRGYGRALVPAETLRLMAQEQGARVSHAYWSQLEHGVRVELSADTQQLLARFFGIHPGYLVADPKNFRHYPRTPGFLEAVAREERASAGTDGLVAALAQLTERPPRAAPEVRRDLENQKMVVKTALVEALGRQDELEQVRATPGTPALERASSYERRLVARLRGEWLALDRGLRAMVAAKSRPPRSRGSAD
jgi:transcriptional regulator with XRE-family HTH domain